jgi:hypothetical protein
MKKYKKNVSNHEDGDKRLDAKGYTSAAPLRLKLIVDDSSLSKGRGGEHRAGVSGCEGKRARSGLACRSSREKAMSVKQERGDENGKAMMR